ncbi:MAG: CRISPR-associated exonuclease Cas4 [Fusobacteriaceae bacterium]|jgi:CRISPR-associated exonuclease Cas4|nr:CRISPR-associated exonuclease Cas4 [Fusobacteriaceae bacterium]
MIEKTKITGLMVYYYFVCKRKLWLFSNGITFEEGNDLVALGKLLDENTYSREKKHISIDNTINIDFIKDWEILHEIKKSRTIEEANIWQIKYYLWFLQQRGIDIKKGVLDYPKLKIRLDVTLSEEDKKEIEKIIVEISEILTNKKSPEKIKSKICKKCAYYEYCFI